MTEPAPGIDFANLPTPAGSAGQPSGGYWSPARTDVMRWVLKPSQCIRPT